jgi:hypothetical protein
MLHPEACISLTGATHMFEMLHWLDLAACTWGAFTDERVASSLVVTVLMKHHPNKKRRSVWRLDNGVYDPHQEPSERQDCRCNRRNPPAFDPQIKPKNYSYQ